ncbi:MAG: DUF3883 domain-containing protein [Helicobacter sp.]|nr:DUF3883 domain-containing protein [Helicobacteraceae bacterium]MDY3113711.1 DUF3883 domain-containing protein [Helicobacter sp.]
MSKKHENYELLNLLGYGLAKFDKELISCFNFNSKSAFFEYLVNLGVAKSSGVIKNRMDLFDFFFPNNRKGWWQKGAAYIHRKEYIDALFGDLDSSEFANIIKLKLSEICPNLSDSLEININPFLQSKFKKMQSTGLEAELYFIHNFREIEILKGGILKDARLFGDGYDFFVKNKNEFLCEIKGLRDAKGGIRLTQKEFLCAKTYAKQYLLVVVKNLENCPKFSYFLNPLKKLEFREKIVESKILEYHLSGDFI